MKLSRSLLPAVLVWPVTTQEGARRNAMVGATALAQRRRELDDVEAFFAARTRLLDPSPATCPSPRSRSDVI